MSQTPAQHVVLLVGSNKPAGTSTSEALGRYLLDQLEPHGFDTTVLFTNRVSHEGKGVTTLLDACDQADVLIVASPLFADTLHALTILALERITAHRTSATRTSATMPKPCQLVGIMNSGFPEAAHNQLALDSLRCFAQQAGFTWAGGLALGGGQALRGQHLDKIKGMARHAVRALELTASALAAGQPIPQQAVDTMAQPIISPWLYTFMGSIGWLVQGAQQDALRKLWDKPYQDEAASSK
ncbi:MAG: hypothetical protein AAF267_12640 [Deinococcota bacterium]